MKEPKVTLLTHTPNPVQTLRAVWDVSKTEKPLDSILKAGSQPDDLELFQKIIAMEIPVAEFIHFIFILEDVPVYFREQLVRHTVGVAFWMQSHRITDLSRFSEDQLYYTPKSISKDLHNKADLDHCMAVIGDTYGKLVQRGVPLEDARAVMPSATIHRLNMVVDLRCLMHMIKQRSCHILQGSIWKPIIDQIIHELEIKVDPSFKMLRNPVCVRHGKFIGCRYDHDNERRLDGRDKLPPCCLWMKEKGIKEESVPNLDTYMEGKEAMVEFFGEEIVA